MLDVNIKIIAELKSFLSICTSEPAILNEFRSSKQDFTRDRKLSFPRLILFITKLCKKTLSLELDTFLENEIKDSRGSCSVSAFSQQRHKLKSFFFEVWNKVLCESFYHHGQEQTKRWNGYRVIAADGSAVSLISTKALALHFGGQSNQCGTYTGAKAFLHYDVLNKLITFAQLATYRTGELTMAYRAIDILEEDTLTIYDRHFCNYKMVALHQWTEGGRRFVIRAKESHKFIASFIKSGARSQEVNMFPTPDAIIELKKSGFIITAKTALKVRLVRVDLPKGVTEVLLTDLWEDEVYTSEIFKDLYFMRWGVETSISVLKNLLQLESFSGQTVKSVEQDFFATIFMANLSALITRQANEEEEEKKQKKKLSKSPPLSSKRSTRDWPMQVNMNKATGKVRQKVVGLFMSKRPDEILRQLSASFRKHMLPIRKGRSFVRERKNKQMHSKHKTFTNYKPSI
jgi:hypothetical protein